MVDFGSGFVWALMVSGIVMTLLGLKTEIWNKKIYLFTTSMLWLFTAMCAGAMIALSDVKDGAVFAALVSLFLGVAYTMFAIWMKDTT